MIVHMETPIILRSGDKSKVEFLGRYKIQKQLGQGAFGTVFKCTTYKGQEYAIKQIHNVKLKKMMNKELDALRSVCSKYVVRYYEIFYDKNDQPCIVLELCDGGTLQEYARKFPNSSIPENLALEIFVKILLGFKAIHEANLIHRDVKLQNIMMRGDDPKIGDFGLATQQKGTTTTTSNEKDKPEGLAGTPAYMAPEVLSGQGYDQQVDVWGLGVLLYAMLFGDHPFLETTAYLQLQKIQTICLPRFQFEKLKKPKHPKITEETIELLEIMLVVEPKSRITIQGLLNHKWIIAHDSTGEINGNNNNNGSNLNPKNSNNNSSTKVISSEDIKKRQMLRSLNSTVGINLTKNTEDTDDPLLDSNEEELKFLEIDTDSNGSFQIDAYLLPYYQLSNRAQLLLSCLDNLTADELPSKGEYSFSVGLQFSSMRNEFSSGQLQAILYYLSRLGLFYLQALNKILDERDNVFGLANWQDFIFSRSYLTFQAAIQKQLQTTMDKATSIYNNLKPLMQLDTPLQDRVSLLPDIEATVIPPAEADVPQQFSFQSSKVPDDLKISSRAVFYSGYIRLCRPNDQDITSNISSNLPTSVKSVSTPSSNTNINHLNGLKSSNNWNSPISNSNNNNISTFTAATTTTTSSFHKIASLKSSNSGGGGNNTPNSLSIPGNTNGKLVSSSTNIPGSPCNTNSPATYKTKISLGNNTPSSSSSSGSQKSMVVSQQQTTKIQTTSNNNNNNSTLKPQKLAKSIAGSAAESRVALARGKVGFRLLLCCTLNHLFLLNDPVIPLPEFQKYLSEMNKNQQSCQLKNSEMLGVFVKWLGEMDLKTIESQSSYIINSFLPQIDQTVMSFF